jgi:hypothetical protein
LIQPDFQSSLGSFIGNKTFENEEKRKFFGNNSLLSICLVFSSPNLTSFYVVVDLEKLISSISLHV